MADSWWNWGRKILVGDRLDQSGPQPARTPQTDRPETQPYRRNQHGVLGWLRDAFGGWLGRQEAPGTPASAEVKAEKVRSGPSGLVMPWFAPFVDNQTNETQAMRLAYREMWRDPNVKAALAGKILSICALDLNIIPADRKGQKKVAKKNRDPRHEQIAEFVRWNLTERVQGCLPEMVWAILSGGLTDGYSVCEKVWGYETAGEYAGHYVLTALKPKDTGNDVVLLTDEFRNVVGVRALRYSGGEIYPPANFVIYQHMPMYGSPVGLSDLRAVYGRWWMLDTVLKLRAMGLEKRALPLLMGEYETSAQKPSVEAAMALARSQSWMSIPKGVRITALEIAGGADAQFASAVADLKEDIFLGIQGATLQALVGQEGTMRGNSKVHQSTADLFKWHLARCMEVQLNDQDSGVIHDIVDLNYVTDRYPRAVLGAIDDEDMVQKSTLHKNLLDMGLKLSKSELYEDYGVTPPDEDDPDDVLEGGQGQQPGGPGGPGAPGMPPVPPPGGDEPPAPEGDDGEAPPEGGGMLSGLQFAEEFDEHEWDESKHPRGEGGRFGSGGNGGKKPARELRQHRERRKEIIREYRAKAEQIRTKMQPKIDRARTALDKAEKKYGPAVERVEKAGKACSVALSSIAQISSLSGSHPKWGAIAEEFRKVKVADGLSLGNFDLDRAFDVLSESPDLIAVALDSLEKSGVAIPSALHEALLAAKESVAVVVDEYHDYSEGMDEIEAAQNRLADADQIDMRIADAKDAAKQKIARSADQARKDYQKRKKASGENFDEHDWDECGEQFDEHDWEESKHPRAKDGRFGSGGGGGKKEKEDRRTGWKTAHAGNKVKEAGYDDAPAPDWAAVTEGQRRSHLAEIASDPDRVKKERAKIVSTLAQAVGLAGKAISWVGSKVYKEMPPWGKKVVDAASAAYSWLDHNVLEKGKELTQRLAMQVAHERGLGDEHVLRVGEACRMMDGVASWLTNIPIAHEVLHEVYHLDGWLGFGLAKIGFCMPTASLGYCAYSAVRNPLAFARAAGKTLLSMVPGLGSKTRAQELYHGAGPKDRTTAEARRSKVHAHAEQGPLFGKDLMGEVLERMDAAGDGADWWMALFCAAFDLTHDARASVEAADEVFAKVGDGTEAAKEIDGTDIAEWLDEYAPPEPKADKHAADDEVSILTARKPTRFAEWDGDKHWHQVTSSNVDWVRYDSDNEVLQVFYKAKGDKPAVGYSYSGVSPDEARALMNASSPGTWVWDNVRVRGKGNKDKTKKTFGQFDEEFEQKHKRGEGGRFGSGGSKKSESRVRGDLPAPTKRNLGLIARTLRGAVERGNKGPKDICIAAAAVIKQAYPEAEIWSGTVYGEPHTIIKLAGKFIDVSSDQFGSGFPDVAVFDPEDTERGGDHDYYADLKRDHHEEKRTQGHKGWENGERVKELFDRAIKKRGAKLKAREESTDFDEEFEQHHKRGDGGKFTSGGAVVRAEHRDKVASIRRSHQEGKDAVRAAHREAKGKIKAEHREKRSAIVEKFKGKIEAEKAKGKKKLAGIKAKAKKIRDKVAALNSEKEANKATVAQAFEAVQHLKDHPAIASYLKGTQGWTPADLLAADKNTAQDLLDTLESAEEEEKVTLVTPDIRAKIKGAVKAEARDEKIDELVTDHENDLNDIDDEHQEAKDSITEKLEAHREERAEALESLDEKTQDKRNLALERAEEAHKANHERHQDELGGTRDAHREKIDAAWEEASDARDEIASDYSGKLIDFEPGTETPQALGYKDAVAKLRDALAGKGKPREVVRLAKELHDQAERFVKSEGDSADHEQDIEEAKAMMGHARNLARSLRKVASLGVKDMSTL